MEGNKRATVIKLCTSKENLPLIKKSTTKPGLKMFRKNTPSFICNFYEYVFFVNRIDDSAVRRLSLLSYIYFL